MSSLPVALPPRRAAPVEIEGGSVARAKQTGRSEARRRYRQAQVDQSADGTGELDFGERRPELGPAKANAPRGAADPRPPSGRLGFMTAFRLAYHPAHIGEDVRALPSILRSRAFFGAVLLVIVGAIGAFAFWDFTGGRFACELTVLPGSALAPQLVAGFFAPRASYLLGLIVGVIQGVAAVVFLTQLATRLGTPLTGEQQSALISQAFLSGPLMGALFAAVAAWYRRFLALSSPRRPQAGRSPAKGNPSRRPASR
jgi:hypothetical protein